MTAIQLHKCRTVFRLLQEAKSEFEGADLPSSLAHQTCSGITGLQARITAAINHHLLAERVAERHAKLQVSLTGLP